MKIYKKYLALSLLLAACGSGPSDGIVGKWKIDSLDCISGTETKAGKLKAGDGITPYFKFDDDSSFSVGAVDKASSEEREQKAAAYSVSANRIIFKPLSGASTSSSSTDEAALTFTLSDGGKKLILENTSSESMELGCAKDEREKFNLSRMN